MTTSSTPAEDDALRDELEARALDRLHAAGRALRLEIERDWPRLTYYYGIQPSELAQMPRWLRNVYIDKLGPIRARERLIAIDEVSFPHMEKEGRRQLVSRLQRIAQSDQLKPKPSKPVSVEEMQGGLACMGIAVEVVKSDA